jgi:hypothetical protein
MGSPVAKVYTTVKISQVENFKHRCRNDMVVNIVTFFVGGVLRRSSFLDNLKSLDKKLGLRETLT